MISRGTELRKKLVALVLVSTMVMSGCSGSGSSGSKAPAGPVASTLQTATDGWSFPNFPSSTYPDVNFDESDLVAMFGSGDKVCVGGTATPCVLTAEASAWARMVNQARSSGHCEGLVALASSRFNGKETPATVELPTQGETLHAIMRTFATQFIPEVQAEIQKWLAASLDDKVDALKTSIAAGKLDYTLGMYTTGGGHALLPYAIEYPEESKPRVMLYDSNWPGKNRYVDIDLKAKTWRFSFSGEDPETDPDVWTGGPDAMDLTPLTARAGTCPFCGGDVKVAKTTMLIRSSNLDWSVESDGETVSPSQPGSGDGLTTRPVKGGQLFSATGEKLTKESYDYIVEIPENAATQSTTTVAAKKKKRKSNLKFKGATSVYALMPSGIAQFTTPGESDEPVVMQGSSISASDPGINMTLASGNLVANASGSAVSLSIEGNTMAVAVTTANGQVVQQEVSADKPTLQMKADPSGGGITVLAATSSGVVEKTEVSSSGQETKSVVTEKLELNSVAAVLPPELASKESTLLPSLANRDMANPNYKVDVAYSAPITVPQKESNNQAADTPTTIAASRSTQGNEPSKSSPTTNAPKTTIGKSSGPTEIDAVRPTLGRFSIPAVTFGDAAFDVKDPTSTSSAAWKFASSKTDVATINASSGKVTIAGAGSTVITASQAAIKGFEAISVTATLVVNRDTPTLGAWSAITKSFGDEAFVIKDPTSNSKGEITFDTSDDDVARINKTSGRVVLYGAGKTTITATQAATDDYASATKTLVLTVKKGIPDLGAFDNMSKTFGDDEFVIAKPKSDSKAAMTFTSSDDKIATINATSGSVVLVGAGTTTIMVSQAGNSDFVALAKTMSLEVKAASPTLGSLSIDAKTFGDEEFTIAKPSTTSAGAVTFSSSKADVLRVTAEGKATIVGAGSAIVTASQAASGGYSAKSVTATVSIAKAAPVISNMTIGNMTYGDAEVTLVPKSTSPAAFSFSSNLDSVVKINKTTGKMEVVGAGVATITASQKSSDNYEAATESVTITIAKASSTVGTFAAVAKDFGEAPFAITAPTSTNTKPFTYSSNNAAVATVIETTGVVTITGVGSATITASQVTSDNYKAVTATTTLTVSKGTPVFSNFIVADKIFGAVPFDVTAPTSTSTGAFTYSVVPTGSPAIAIINSSTGRITIIGVGSATIRITQAATTNYVAGSISTSLTVAPAAPTFGAFTIASKTYGDADFVVTPPTSTSTGAFTFSSSDTGVATVDVRSGVVYLQIVGGGTTTISAIQQANGNYAERTITASLVVGRATATLSGFGTAASGLAGVRYEGYFDDDVNWFSTATPHGDTNTLNNFNRFSSSSDYGSIDDYSWQWRGIFKASDSGTYQFCTASDDASYLWLGNEADSGFTTGNAVVNNGGAHGVQQACGSKGLTAGQEYPIRIQFGEAGGGDEITVSFTPPSGSESTNGSGYFYTNGGITKTVGDAAFTPTLPTSVSTGAITYTSSNPAVATVGITTGLITVLTSGTTTITASQAATANYTASSSTSVVTVFASPNLTAFSIPAKSTSDGTFTVAPPTSDSTGAITYSSSLPSVASIHATSGLVTIGAAGTTTITATQAATVTHGAGSISASFVVGGAFSGMSPETAAASATQLKTVNGYTTSGNYWIKPTGYTGAAQKVWVEFDRGGNSYVLIGKGRQSNDARGGWFGTDSELATNGLLQENASSAGISKLSAEFVNFLMNGTANGWMNSDAQNYLVANRIATATDGYEGIGDSFKLKVTSTPTFSWVNQFGSADGYPSGSGEIARYSTQWMTGASDGSVAGGLGDNGFGCNCTNRLFTWQWGGHGSYHGWSSGVGETRGFVETNEQHAIQFVQLWLRS